MKETSNMLVKPSQFKLGDLVRFGGFTAGTSSVGYVTEIELKKDAVEDAHDEAIYFIFVHWFKRPNGNGQLQPSVYTENDGWITKIEA